MNDMIRSVCGRADSSLYTPRIMNICLISLVTATFIGVAHVNGAGRRVYLIDKLRKSLFKNYDSTVRPTEHSATNVKIALQFARIVLDEFTGTMTTYGRVASYWTDLRLRWNETEYDDMNVVSLARQEIWHPELQVFNSASLDPVIKDDDPGPCLCYQNGEMLCLLHATFTVHCEFNLRHWPFDTQTCRILLGSWTNYDINLRFSPDHSDITDMVQSFMGWQGWDLLHIKRFRREKWFIPLNNTAAQLEIAITLRRQSPSYIAIIIAPAVAVILMTLIGFLLPLNAREKIILNAFTIIIISSLFIYFFQRIPSMATNTPLIVIFYSASLCLISVSLVISVGIMNLYNETSNVQLTSWLSSTIDIIDWMTGLKCIACTKCGPRFKLPDGRSGSSAYRSEWIKIATVLNRVCFLIYCFVFSIFSYCILYNTDYQKL